jgi:hypothetical protein
MANFYRKSKKSSRKRMIGAAAITLLILSAAFISGLFMYTAYRLTGTVVPTAELFDGKPTIRFVDVGQGDCILLQAGRRSFLVDCGSSSCKPISYSLLPTPSSSPASPRR